MKIVFADSFYFIAILSHSDQHHERTLKLMRGLRARFVTTHWVLTEVVDALAKGDDRVQAVKFVRHLSKSADWDVIPYSDDLWSRALEYFERHRDKEWTLTDCTSCIVMQERGIKEALTGDHHFEQAGFTALLK